MKFLLRYALPAVIAAAMLFLGGAAYARFLGTATAVTRDVVPPAKPPVAVVVNGSRLVVHTSLTVTRIDAGGIAWDLPVLLCLWAWVVGRRWGWLAAAALLFAGLHVLVADVEVRKALGDVPPLAYAFTRAWFHFASAALPVFVVAIGWAAGRRTAEAGGATGNPS